MLPVAQPARMILIRHGETDWNAVGRIQGQIDTPLSALGRQQAARLAAALAGEPIDGVICSDLQRAVQTAQPLADVIGVALEPVMCLRERAYGAFEGSTHAEIAARDPLAYARWRERDPEFDLLGGESATRFTARVTTCLFDLARRWRGRLAVVVTHGGVLDVAYRYAHGIDWRTPRTHALLNASVNRIDVDADRRQIRISAWADVDRLSDAGDDAQE